MARSGPVPLADVHVLAGSDGTHREWLSLVLTIVFTMSAVAMLVWTLASLLSATL